MIGSVAAGQDADRAGPLRAYLGALASFGAGSILAASAGSWTLLLAGRALEGLGAGALGVEPWWVDRAGGLRLRPDYWPERGGMDGFYAACLAKPGDAA